jgi:tetratricopeptide (TPR) repeat protein
MKKMVLTMVMFFGVLQFMMPHVVHAYNFGDHRSETLVTRAWGSLAQGDIEAVLAYTNKTLELYGEEAKKMKAALSDYVKGEKEQVFANWALNDVATALFIQGEAYRKANMIEEAKDAYNLLIEDYTFGQAWDPKGWFWKPAEAAKEKIKMLESGLKLDFGDYTSSFLVGQAWQALGRSDYQSVDAYVEKVVELYDEEARKMQQSIQETTNEFPWPNEEVFEYWALNDVGTAMFVKAEALKKAGDEVGAKEVYETLVKNYYFSQCWDPNGWFWKPAEAAQEALENL